MNRLYSIFNDRYINVKAFADRNDIPPTTLYTALSERAKMERLSIELFKKIAHGLNMTIDELYSLVFDD